MINLETPVRDTFRKDVSLADSTLLDPLESDALEQGEWLTKGSSGYARVGASSVAMAHPIFTQKGDMAAQAIDKCTILTLHNFVGETDMYEDAGGGWTLNAYLTVKSITVDSTTRSGLTQAVQGTDYVYAVVDELPANNNSLLKFRTVSPFFWQADT